MEHQTATAFWREYRALDSPSATFPTTIAAIEESGERAGDEIWSVRVTLSYRALAFKRANGYLWFWIGDHRPYETLID